MPANLDFIRITALGMLQGASNPVINVWDYRLDGLTEPIPLQLLGEDIAASFVARYYTPITAAISTRYSLTGLSMRVYGKPAEGWDGADTYFTGGDPTPMMPPFVAYSVMRVRNNFSFKRQGRKSYAGVPTSAIDANGFPNGAVLGVFNAAFNVWETLTWNIESNAAPALQGTDVLVKDADIRVVPNVVSTISGYQLRGFGSQNGRKGN